MTREQSAPPSIPNRIKAVPRIRQLYWCDFPVDAHLPEFWKRRPVVIISYRNTLAGAVTVIPCSSQSQPDNPWAFSLTTTIDGADSWAICDKPTTVAVSRLSIDQNGIKRLTEIEFHGVLEILFKWLPVLPQNEFKDLP